MERVIDGKKYDTEKATIVADNEFSDGSNRMNCGRCTLLYKTKKGNFFAAYETCWQGEYDTIDPLTINEAKEMFEGLRNQLGKYEEVFGEAEEA